jgi:hypothetical protein
VESHGAEEFWAFCPSELTGVRDELRESANPLYLFLKTSTQIRHQPGHKALLDDVRLAYSKHIGKTVKRIDRATFRQVNSEYVIVTVKRCKSCNSEKGAGCCPSYRHGNRTSTDYINNMLLVETQTGTEI